MTTALIGDLTNGSKPFETASKKSKKILELQLTDFQQIFNKINKIKTAKCGNNQSNSDCSNHR